MATNIKTRRLAPPERRHLIGEFFAAKDMLGAPAALALSTLAPTTPVDNLRVMVLPGLGANDLSTAPLRRYLAANGFKSEGWGLGINDGGRGRGRDLSELSGRWDIDRTRPTRGEGEVPALTDRVYSRVRQRAEKAGAPYVLVGWSLGGFIAREVARDLPDHVAAVITLGSPIVGGPKYTAVAPLFRARRIDVDWIAEETEKRFDKPITQPITAIYSKSDGIVGWTAAVDDRSPNVRNVEVSSSHFGIGLNAAAWRIVRDAIRDASERLDAPAD